MATFTSSPALTYTLEDFVRVKDSDDMTYRNFSILEIINGVELLDHNLLDDYADILSSICQDVELTPEQYNKYAYFPDLLAYDIYGSTQLDFVILFANDMIDPKEFNLKKVKLPFASALSEFLSQIYNSNSGYITQNREDNGLKSD